METLEEMIDLNNEKLQLNYPCVWKYKVILLKTKNVKEILKDIFLQREYTFDISNQSSKEKFESYNLELFVQDENDRTSIYHMLGEHKDIKMVL